MSQRKTRWMLPCIALVVAVFAGCANEPKQADVSPLNEPIDAFEAVGAPRRAGGAPQSERETLSSDIERLQNARDTYEHEQQRLSAQMKREQAECRQNTDSRQVAIQDGSGDPNAVYCQPADATKQ